MNPATEEQKRESVLAWRSLKETTKHVVVVRGWPLVFPIPLSLAALAALSIGKPGAALVCFTAAFGAFALIFGEVETEIVPEPMASGPVGYRGANDALRGSPKPLDREHVFVGTTEDMRESVLAHRSYYPMHVLALGATGSEKTSTIECSQLEQLMEMGDVSIDLTLFKMDTTTASRLAFKAHVLGMDVLFFTTMAGKATRLWNPFLDPAFRNMPPSQAAELFLAAEGMSKGEAHGQGFFTAENEAVHRAAFTRLLCRSFREYAAILKDKSARKMSGLDSRKLETGSHTLTVWERLGMVEAANRVPGDGLPQSLFDNAITTDRLIKKPTLVIRMLPALISPTTPQILARLDLLLTIARLHQWKGPRVRNVVMAYDDCAPLVEQTLKQIFAAARELDLCLFLCTQSLSDFKNDDVDLRQIVMTNTALKLFATVKDTDGQDYLIRSSGETTRTLGSSGESETEGPAGTGRGRHQQLREVVVPRLTAEDISRVNADPGLMIVEATPRRGYSDLTRPTVVRLHRSITPEEYEWFKSMPWPEPDGVTTTSFDAPPPAAPVVNEPTDESPEHSRKEKRKGKPSATPEEIEEGERERERLRAYRNKPS